MLFQPLIDGHLDSHEVMVDHLRHEPHFVTRRRLIGRRRIPRGRRNERTEHECRAYREPIPEQPGREPRLLHFSNAHCYLLVLKMTCRSVAGSRPAASLGYPMTRGCVRPARAATSGRLGVAGPRRGSYWAALDLLEDAERLPTMPAI